MDLGASSLEKDSIYLPPKCSSLPVREISNEGDLARLHQSETFKQFFAFIQTLGGAIQSQSARPFYSSLPSNPHLRWAHELLKEMQERIRHYPPLTTLNSRFGNPTFRDWLDNVRQFVYEQHGQQSALPLEYRDEIASYLVNSLGDWHRLDYGTGHEAHFAAWLYCLCQALPLDKGDTQSESVQQIPSFFSSTDYGHLILLIFRQYMSLMRTLQSTYWLEPAGSHGVWGLDDYHFLPFLWGAAQLIDHPQNLHPKCIHDADLVESLASDYLYMDCIHAINRVKTKVGLAWHSPLLNDISAVRTWSKVYEGLVKMYRVEVLGKLPIMQHFLFGRILPFKGNREERAPVGVTHLHHNPILGRGDCCGNPLPSIYASMGLGEGAGVSTTNRANDVGKDSVCRTTHQCQNHPPPPGGGIPFD